MSFKISTASLLVFLAIVGCSGFQTDLQAQVRPASQWVFTGADGKLQYATDAQGDRIPDFSTSGYRDGLDRIPTATVQVTVDPAAGDDSARIQAAIDQVSALPVGTDGLRGAVLLTRGDYEVAATLRIQTGGVVLRGEGQYGNGTVITATGTTQRNALEIIGFDSTPFWSRVSGSTVSVTDNYVPVGSTTFSVINGQNFSVGDDIVINRGSTQAWFEDIGTDTLEFPWVPGGKDLRFDRTITEINENQITVDAPIVNALEQGTYGAVTVYKYNFPDRVRNVGIENLRFVSQTNGSSTDENHAWTAIKIDAAENVWVREVDVKNFGFSAVDTGKTAKAVTVEDVSYLNPVSQITGSRRYSFNIQGSETVVQRVFSEDARHDFVNDSLTAGPNVFLFATAKDTNNDIGPHHRWSAGTLFDNVHVTGDGINVRWRGNSGTGHGWAGANMVVWNSVAEAFQIQNPPTAQNWVIGATGGPVWIGGFEIGSYNGTLELGNTDSTGTPVAPNSLYIAQLREKFSSQPGTPGNVTIDSRSNLLGDIDNFSFQSDGSDVFGVDADFLFGMSETSSVAHGTFDSNQRDRSLAFTHNLGLAPGEEVVSATLELSLRVLDANFYRDDVLRLGNHAARFHLRDTLDVPSNLQVGDDYVLTLDLVDLFGPLLSPLQDGQFSVLLSDDHAIDYSRLIFEVASTSVLLGDVNQDGVVNFLDIAPFIDFLTNGNYLEEADCNLDGVVTFLDIAPFIAILSGN